MDVLGNVSNEERVSEHPAKGGCVEFGGVLTGEAMSSQEVVVIEVAQCRYSCRPHENIKGTH